MKSGSKSTAIVLLFIALVLINFLASRMPGRVDATADRIYTLSDGTKSLLAKIEEPISLEFYFSRNAQRLPATLKNYAERVQEMLRQYVRASRGKLTLTVINPQQDTPDEERALIAGIENQGGVEAGDTFMFGLSAVQADKQKTIQAFTMGREQYLEYDISQLIYSVQQVVKKKLGLITSLPLVPKNDMQAQMTNAVQNGMVVNSEWARTFDVVTIQPNLAVLPAGLDVLAIVHPQAVHPKLLFAIDQFLLSGKPVFVAVDPSSMWFHSSTTPLQMIQGGTNNGNSDLAPLSGWGVMYNIEKVVGDPSVSTKVQATRASTPVSTPFLLSQRSGFNKEAMATSNLTFLQLPEAGSVSLAPGSTLSFTPLVETTENAGEVSAELFTDRTTNIEAIANSLKPSGKKAIAALFSGKFKTAFPEGIPADPTGPDGNPIPAPPSPGNITPMPLPTPPLKEGSAISNLIVIADSDFMLDLYGLIQDAFGSFQLRNDNLSFAVNAVEFLGGSQDLISLRGKKSSVRPFSVVDDIELAAQKKYGEQQKALLDKQKDVQAKLSQLQVEASETRQLVPSPELTAAIDDYRKQSVAVNSELRLIRRSLRTDIDALENKLLAINLLSTPVLVVLFGLWFYRRRQRT